MGTKTTEKKLLKVEGDKAEPKKMSLSTVDALINLLKNKVPTIYYSEQEKLAALNKTYLSDVDAFRVKYFKEDGTSDYPQIEINKFYYEQESSLSSSDFAYLEKESLISRLEGFSLSFRERELLFDHCVIKK